MTTRPSGHQRHAAPPLAWLWAIAIFLVTLAFYVIWLDRMEFPKSIAFRDYNLARIASFDAAFPKGEAFRVVTIGNSRLKFGILDDDEMTELARKMGTGRFGVLRLVNNWAVFEDFELLTDQLLAIRPDVIVLQLDLLGTERAESNTASLKREYLIWQLFGYGPWHPYFESPDAMQYDKPCAGVDPETHVKTRIPRTRRFLTIDVPGASGRLAQAFIREAARAGIPVTVMTIPSTAIMERAHPSDQRPFLEALAEARKAGGDIPLLRYPDPIPDHGFCDAVHMNEAGRTAFSRWFISKLTSRFRNGGNS